MRWGRYVHGKCVSNEKFSAGAKCWLSDDSKTLVSQKTHVSALHSQRVTARVNTKDGVRERV